MPRVLVVDDAPMFREYLATMLGRIGVVADLVGDARTALARLEHHSYDAVITDVMMPDMDGIEFVRALHARLPNLPIVVATGCAADLRGPLANVLSAYGVKATLDKSMPWRHFADAVLDACRYNSAIS